MKNVVYRKRPMNWSILNSGILTLDACEKERLKAQFFAQSGIKGVCINIKITNQEYKATMLYVKRKHDNDCIQIRFTKKVQTMYKGMFARTYSYYLKKRTEYNEAGKDVRTISAPSHLNQFIEIVQTGGLSFSVSLWYND